MFRDGPLNQRTSFASPLRGSTPTIVGRSPFHSHIGSPDFSRSRLVVRAMTGNEDVFLRDGDVVDDPDVGRLQPHLFRDLALRVHGVHGDVVGQVALGLVAIGDHLARHRVDLRVRRHAGGGVLAVEVPRPEGFERVRVDVPGQCVLFQHQQLAAVPVHMRVGGGAVELRDARVVGEVVAIHAIQAFARLALGHQALRLHVAALVVDRAVREAEAADVAVAVEAGRPLVLRRAVLEVALHAVERAFDVRGNLAPDLAVVDIRLEPRRAVEPARKHRMTPEIHCHCLTPRDSRPATRGGLFPQTGRQFKRRLKSAPLPELRRGPGGSRHRPGKTQGRCRARLPPRRPRKAARDSARANGMRIDGCVPVES